MKKYSFLVFAFFYFAFAGNAQLPANASTKEAQIDSICKLIVKFSNQKETEKMYALTGPAFKKNVNFDSFKGSAENNLYPLNKIIKTEFLKHQNGMSTYKVYFADLSFLLDLSIDEKRKLVSFLWSPNANQ